MLSLGAIVAVALGMIGSTGVASAGIVCGPSASPPSTCPTPTDLRNDYPTRTGTVVVIRYGPYSIPANGSIHNTPINFSAQVPCTNCYITDMIPDLVYEGDANHTDGTSANLNSNMMLHHFVLINPQRQDAVCPTGLEGQLGERFFAAGNERTHMHLPSPYGYLNTRSTWDLIPHIINKSTTTSQSVSIQVTYRYTTASSSPAPVESKPLWLDIDGCGDSEYTIPTGYSDTHDQRQNAPVGTYGWPSTVDGRMIAMSGHLHDVDITDANPCDIHCANEGGGIAVSAELVGGAPDYWGPVPPNNPPPADLTGTTLCRSEGSYGTTFAGTTWKGHLDTMSECGIQTNLPANHQPEAYPPGTAYPLDGIPFKKNQVIELHSEYENGTGSQATDVMGIMMAWYVPPGTPYVRPKGATPLRVTLVPAYTACSSPNSTHGSPLSSPSCNPPSRTSSTLTIGTPDANGAAANFAGFAKFRTIAGNPATTADEADVAVTVDATDVRKNDLTDYTGQLKATSTIRFTDRDNGPTEVGTTQDIPLSFTVPCAATADTSVGSHCSLTTTADAVTPNTVKEGKRTIWQMSKVDVFDGGSDGVASTNPNTLFATQGYFVP